MKNSNQRIGLTDAQDYAVRQIGLKESRPYANVLSKLIDEALSARRRADSDVTALVAVLRTRAAP
jgi:hypothetical protein